MPRKIKVRKHKRRKPKSDEKTTVKEHTRKLTKKKRKVTKARKVRKLSDFLRKKGYTRHITPFGVVLIDPSHTIAVGCPYVLRNILYSKFLEQGRRPKYKKFRLVGTKNISGMDVVVFRSGRSYIYINPKLFKEALKIVGKNASYKGYLKDTPLILEAKGRPAAMIAPLILSKKTRR